MNVLQQIQNQLNKEKQIINKNEIIFAIITIDAHISKGYSYIVNKSNISHFEIKMDNGDFWNIPHSHFDKYFIKYTTPSDDVAAGHGAC